MATVAAPSVGARPTVPMDWSPLARSWVTMMLLRVDARMAAWLMIESRRDAWASYGALALASVVTAASFGLSLF